MFGVKNSKLVGAQVSSTVTVAAGNMAQASTTTSQEDVLEWAKKDRRRLLHVVYRVGDMEKTIKYPISLNSNLPTSMHRSMEP